MYLEKAWYRKAGKATLAKTVAKSFAFHEVDDQLILFYKNETAISDQFSADMPKNYLVTSSLLTF